MIEEAVKEELISRLNQISEDNNYEPIYNSFVRWVCENYLGIDDDDDIANIIDVGGKHDYGVDFFVHKESASKDESYISWGQVKFSETFDKSVNREEMEQFAKTLIYLRDAPSNANSRFIEHSKKFNQLGGIDSSIRKTMIFVVAGKLNDDVELLLDSKDWKRNFQNTRGPPVDVQIIDIDKIIDDLVRKKTPTFSLKFDEFVLEKEDKSTGLKSIQGFVKANELTTIVNRYPGMFDLNIRQSLGKTKPSYKGMTRILNDPKKKKQFWKFNNGVTAVCKKFDKIIGKNPIEYTIEDFQIVNGRQTTYCLHENNIETPGILDDDVIVSIKIHQVESEEESNEITSATNTQNTVREVDQISNFEEIRELTIQCRDKFPEFYFERQTAGFNAAKLETRRRVTKKRLLDKEKTARSYLAYSTNEPNNAIIPSKDLFSTIDPTYYNSVFKNRKIQELIIPHIFSQILNALDLKWGNEHRKGDNTNYFQKQILHKDIVKYFILDLIGMSMRGLPEPKRKQIEEKLIEKIKVLETRNPIPKELLKIAEESLDYFMYLFDENKSITWPEELLTKLRTPGYTPSNLDKPDHDDIRRVLIASGSMVRKEFMDKRERDIKRGLEDQISKSIVTNLEI